MQTFGIHNTDKMQVGIHKHMHVYGDAPLRHMSLQLPWAVAFIAEGIGRDVNKVVDCSEITLLAKTKGKEANS